jgi:phage terminase large subunit-like protein
MTTRDEAAKALKLLTDIDRRRKYNAIDFYRPYPKQQEFHDYGLTKRERLFMAGNRCGKTFCGADELAFHLTGKYPDWWLGRRFERPIQAWAGSDTSTTTRDIVQSALCGDYSDSEKFGTGSIPRDCVDWKNDISLARGVTDAFDTVLVKHFTNGTYDGKSPLAFKSYDQGRKKWQGTAKDAIWLDEEPDPDIYSEAKARIAPTKAGQQGGIIYMTFTPLQGLSKVVNTFLSEENKDRSVTTMTIDDAKHIDLAERKKIIDGYEDYEREARAMGVPMLGSGRIFTVAEKSVAIEPFEIPFFWPRLWSIDFGVNHPFAAVLNAWDRDADIVYVIACVRMKNKLPIDHVLAMKSFGVDIRVAWPQDGHQREEYDGKLVPTAKIYKAHGANMLSHHATFPDGSNSTEAGITMMQERMRLLKYRVFSTCKEWFEEYRTYHRKDGLIVKERDDLMSASRIGIMALREARVREKDLGRLQGGGSVKMARGARTDLWGA